MVKKGSGSQRRPTVTVDLGAALQLLDLQRASLQKKLRKVITRSEHLRTLLRFASSNWVNLKVKVEEYLE